MHKINNLPKDFRPLGKAIEAENAGRRIDELLSISYPFQSRSTWKKKIKQKEVLVNLSPVRGAYRLKLDDQIIYFQPRSEEPDVDKGIKVVWESNGVIAVYKPSNLPMHEGGRYFKNTFAEVMKEKIGAEWAAVHRLDRETSGIVLCAATKKMRAELSEEFANRVIKKTYVAIARGVPEKNEWLVDEKIGDLKGSSFRLKKWVVEDGQPSQTLFKVINQTSSHSYLHVFPRTGRTHQIRVHAAWCGLPLVGEKKYFPDESVFLEYMKDGLTDRVVELTEARRLCLHAASLSFRHPATERVAEIGCPIPEEMAAIWRRLCVADVADVADVAETNTTSSVKLTPFE